MSGKGKDWFSGPRWLRRLIVTAVVLTVIAGLTISLLPMAIRFGAVNWLEEHGAQNAEIANVDLNLFSGTFAVEGVKAGDGLQIGRFAIDIDWWPMREHRLLIRSLALQNVHADLHQGQDGAWQLSTLTPDPVAQPRPETEPDSKPESIEEPWHLLLDKIDVSDVNVSVNGKVEKQPFNVALKLDAFELSLKQRGSDDSQTFDLSLALGRSSAEGFGLRVSNERLELSHRLLLSAIGSGMEDGVSIEELNMKNSEFGLSSEKGSAQLLSIASLELQGGKIASDGAVSMQRLQINRLLASLHKGKDGRMVVPGISASSGSRDATAEASAGKSRKSADAKAGAPIRIGELVIGRGSRLSYRDESLFPPFDTKLEVERFSFAPVDLSGSEAGRLDAKFVLNKNGSLTAKGSVTPSANAAAAALEIDLKNFDMPGLTGFVEKDFGQAIRTGQMDLNSKISIAANRINAKNRLTLRKLVLEKAKQPGKLEQGLGMPVDMALDMLRDDRGDIVMNVPIKGRLDDPDVNASSVINTALTGAMSSGAMTYAKLALQPYGAILMAGEFALKQARSAAKPKLTPIRFKERSPSLDDAMEDYASKIAALMKQKDFRLQICGVATRIEGGGATPDRPRILDDEQLLKLAEKRSDAVVQAIQGKGVAADRLYNCRPVIDENKKGAEPRVDMLLD